MFQALENREKLSGLSARWADDVAGGGGGGDSRARGLMHLQERGFDACSWGQSCALGHRPAWVHGWLDEEVGVDSGALWAGNLSRVWL